MPEVKPEARIAILRAEIARHDALYFRQAAPEISDSEYDRLKEELAALERAHPELAMVPPASPGFDDRSGRFPTARHSEPMLSLEKVYDEDALRSFYARVSREIDRDGITFIVEPKIDGIAISVTYERGRLVRAVTRGDGNEGDNITENVLTIEGLPRELAARGGGDAPELIEIRGEVYLTFDAFARINREREAAGEPPFANPRNAAAGTARLDDPDAVAGRGLQIAFYGLGACEPASARPASQQATLARIAAWGLPVVDRAVVVCDAEVLWQTVCALGEERAGLAYPTDGVVVKLDDIAWRAKCGDSPQGPRWAVAYKYAPRRAATRVRAITIQVGRTGVLTPVAEFDPVDLAGSTVARASLHNRDALARLDVRVGDAVFVEKAGEIIPEIVAVDRGRRSPESAAFVFPETCPACATAVVSGEGGALVRCPSEACPAQVRRRLEHFASMAAVNIAGLGPATIGALVERGWVDDPADFYRLERAQVLGLGADVVVSSDALLSAIERSKSAELWRVIHGLGIPRVGETTARDLATVYPDLAAFGDLSAADFDAAGRAAVLDLGRATEQALLFWFAEARHRALVRDLAGQGVGANATYRAQASSSALAGKVVVLTGRLEHLERDEAINRIRAAGGRVVASVSRRTDYVVAGENPGEKLARARELGVPVIEEAAFLRLLEETP
ncbi:MAG: NAD-dependent DNA ligase LigA [Opitutaceae bacterium]|nr:NAD-dependent DNA ligase LigA [Opitutaceae bacterium]